MDKKQAQQTIDDVLQHPFNREKFINFIRNLLNNIESRNRHYSGNLVPEAYRDHVSQYWRMGKYISPDDEEVDILIVEVKSLSKLDRARTTLRNFAINRLKQFEKDYSLIAFYAKEDLGADWRFSYVKIEHESYQDDKGKVKTRTELTPARRYSFLVGEHENSYTAQKQLLPLLEVEIADPTLEEIEQAFSIEKVTDEFFQQYKELYIKLSEHLKTQSLFVADSQEKIDLKVARFAKKLLGQIVFLYFLQKKGWLGVAKDIPWGKGDKKFLRNRYQQASEDNKNYYADFLQYLFYEALAQERENHWYQRFDCKIPFLNGGLFEADYDWKKHPVAIPNALFHNTEKNKAGDIGTGILDVFDRYNFTIKEDEPLEKEVAVDPEMLGKVFENMLEVTERKSKGAYYTPREIVHYMCQESLIHYLQDVAQHIPKTELEDFIRKGHLFLENDAAAIQAAKKIASGEQKTTTHSSGLPASILENTELLDEKLANIRICDPAIGSGAFPVGLLHEIVNARLILKTLAGEKASAYGLKRHCIQQSIYGVDIDASAIDISRLRLWLSLIVDEPDYGAIAALPNLDYKIMQGNSLVEDYDGIKLFNDDFLEQQNNTEAEIQRLKEQSNQLQAEYLKLHQANQLSADRKRQLEKQNQSLLKQIKKLQNASVNPEAQSDLSEFDRVNAAKQKAIQLEQLHKQYFSASTPEKKAQIRNKISELEWELIEATLKERNQTEALQKIQRLKQSNEKPFFLWKLNFPEVFKQHGGFDVVIGNPPYVQIQKFSGQQIQKDWENQHYATFTKTGDIYCLFYEKGNRILRENGTLAFITSNKWMRANYGKKLRNYLNHNTNPNILIDFGSYLVFDSATVVTNILFFDKKNNQKQTKACAINSEFNKDSSLVNFIDKHYITLDDLSEDSWVISSKEHYEIKKRMEELGVPLLEWDISIYRGILTGLNEAFIIDGQKKNELISRDSKNAEIIKPILRGQDIKRYKVNFNDIWLIDSHNGFKNIDAINIDDYPTIKLYLDQFGSRLINRYDQGKTPYNLRNCAYHQEFEKEKIVWGNLALSAQFAIAPEKTFINAPSPLIAVGNKYLLAVLNSKPGDYYIRSLGVTRNGGYFEYKPMFVEKLPVPKLSDNEQKPFVTLVGYVLFCKETDLKLQTAYFEQLIDGLVYELYFADEINAANKAILKHIGDLKPISEKMTEEEKRAIIQIEFDRLYDPGHPVRNHLETLDSVEEVRIIKEALA